MLTTLSPTTTTTTTTGNNDVEEEDHHDDEANINDDDSEGGGWTGTNSIARTTKFKHMVTERTARLNPYHMKDPQRAALLFSRNIRPVFGDEHPPLLLHLIWSR